MNKAQLIEDLRQRQRKAGYISIDILESVSDADVLDSYVRCAQCGWRGISDERLDKIIVQARDTQHFLDLAEVEEHSPHTPRMT